MYRGTTPTYILTLPQDIDLDDAAEVVVTFSDYHYKPILEKSGADLGIEDNTISVFLSQEETLRFPEGKVRIQVNWTYNSGGQMLRACSEIATIHAQKNLKNEVI